VQIAMAEDVRGGARPRPEEGLTRRELGKLGLGAAVAAGGLLLGARRARAQDDKLVTEIEANAPIVSQLQYVNESPFPDKHCSNCVLYQGAPDSDRGKCPLFVQGVVAAQGHCMSWAPKPAAS